MLGAVTIDVVTLAVALAEVGVPGGVTVSWGLGEKNRTNVVPWQLCYLRFLALSCSHRSSTGRVRSCVMAAVDHEDGLERLKAPRLAWTALDFFVRAMHGIRCWVGRQLGL